MGDYREQDCSRVAILVSDDNGVTWYPRHGNPALAEPLSTQSEGWAICDSADAGVTWTART